MQELKHFHWVTEQQPLFGVETVGRGGDPWPGVTDLDPLGMTLDFSEFKFIASTTIEYG